MITLCKNINRLSTLGGALDDHRASLIHDVLDPSIWSVVEQHGGTKPFGREMPTFITTAGSPDPQQAMESLVAQSSLMTIFAAEAIHSGIIDTGQFMDAFWLGLAAECLLSGHAFPPQDGSRWPMPAVLIWPAVREKRQPPREMYHVGMAHVPRASIATSYDQWRSLVDCESLLRPQIRPYLLDHGGAVVMVSWTAGATGSVALATLPAHLSPNEVIERMDSDDLMSPAHVFNRALRHMTRSCALETAA